MTVETNITNNNSSTIIPQPRKQPNPADWLRSVRNRGCLEEGLTEASIVRQIIFVFANNISSDIV